MKKGQHIKVHLPGEWLWAKYLGGHQAQLDNMPLAEGWAYGDVVEFDPDSKEVTKLVKRTFRAGGVRYGIPKNATTEQITAVAKPLYEKLEKAGIQCEGYIPGMFGVAIPEKMTNEEARKIVEDAGAALVIDDEKPDKKPKRKKR